MEGFLLIDKPAGITSHDVVDRLRKTTGIRRIGHAGTLDPFATGLLLIGIGPYTKKLANYVGLDKTYEVSSRLGATSTTYDPEGEICVSDVAHFPDRQDVESVLIKFTGEHEQKAPLFSAKKVGGRALYKLARSGRADESMRPSKLVRITELQLLQYHWPELQLRVSCSSGTYIRTLVHDIGQVLGVGAHATQLRRLSIGAFSVQKAHKLENLNEQNISQALFLDSEAVR